MKLIIIIILLITPVVNAGYLVNDPLDCEPNNKDIFLGQLEICNDGIDNNCNGDYTILFDNDPSTGVDDKDVACANELGDAKINFITSAIPLTSKNIETEFLLDIRKVINRIINLFTIK